MYVLKRLIKTLKQMGGYNWRKSVSDKKQKKLKKRSKTIKKRTTMRGGRKYKK